MSKFYLHIAAASAGKARASLFMIAALLLLLMDGCAVPRSSAQDAITVEGGVSVRGNEPFTELVLQTDDRNYYVLKFASPEERGRVQNQAPSRFVVTGDVYRDVWGGRAFAHLRVKSWQPVP